MAYITERPKRRYSSPEIATKYSCYYYLELFRNKHTHLHCNMFFVKYFHENFYENLHNSNVHVFTRMQVHCK